MVASRAATHSTPGASLRSKSGSGPMPSGNRLTTMTKKNSAETMSAWRRMASLRSRPTTAKMIFSIASPSGKPQFAHRAGWNGNQLVGGHHGQAAALQVAGDDAGQPIDSRYIEGDEGFVEHPERAAFLDQAGQRDAALLALRQVFAGQILASGQANLLQRVERVVFRQVLVGQVGRGEQVLERGQFFLDGVQVAEIAQVGAEIVADCAEWTGPASGFRRLPAARGR